MKEILYIEDSVTAQMLMRRYLSGLGELTITTGLVAADELLKTRKFDLVICDYLFPEGTALNLIQRIRATHTATTLPILVVSSSMDGLLLSRIVKAGANDGLAKPLRTDELRTCVHRLLNETYVRTLDSAIWGVPCLQWEADGQVHQYCPDIDLKLSGATRAEVEKRMAEVLQQRCAAGIQFGSVSRECIVTHVVDSARIHAATGAEKNR